MSKIKDAEVAIEISNLTVSYEGVCALKDVSLSVKDGDFLGIMGPNGGGKSTLLKSILGFIKPDKGSIRLYGESVKKNKQLLGYVPQFSAVDRKFPVSVEEVVQMGHLKGAFHPLHRFSKTERAQSFYQLERLGIENLAKRQISALSGGEFQRLLLARALASHPKILLLDEPTASVDPASRDAIYTILEDLNKSVTILIVTHDMSAVSSSIKTLACLNTHFVYHGNPQLTEEIVSAMYGCPVDLIAHGLPHRVLSPKDHACGVKK